MLHCAVFEQLTSMEEVKDGLVYLSYVAFTSVCLVFLFF